MVWTVPPMLLPEDSLTADYFNTYVRDNLLVTGPAVMTEPNQMLVTSGLNQVAGRKPEQATHVDQVSTTSTTPTGLSSEDVTVTVEHGGAVMVLFAAEMRRTGTDTVFCGPEVIGDVNNEATIIRSLNWAGSNWTRMGAFMFYYGLTPGESSFRLMQWVETAGDEGTYANRNIIAWPL